MFGNLMNLNSQNQFSPSKFFHAWSASLVCSAHAGFMLIFGTVLLSSCAASFKVQTDTPNPGDFVHYKTFKFFNPKNMPGSNFSFSEENQKIIFDAIAKEMEIRGYSSQQQADLIIKVQGGTKSTEEIKNDRYNTMPYYGGYGYGYDPFYNNQYQDISKKETTIIIDVIDAETNKLVWEGVGTGVLGKRHTEVAGKILDAIKQIFEEYPHKAAG